MTASYRDRLFKYVKKKYGALPEYLWKRFPGYAVFRHQDNRKWFALIMDVSRNKLGIPGDEMVDILNIKLDDPVYADILIRQEGYFRGYHISKGNWISILLDGTVPFQEVCGMLDAGYLTTASKKKKKENRPKKEWIIPANPKYYDIEHAFDETDVIRWKQGSGIKEGDTVFMYVGAPVSSILYKCLVTETDIPYQYQDEKLSISALMMIKLKKRYKPEKFPFAVLKEKYGIYAVRGPRGIPNTLSRALK